MTIYQNRTTVAEWYGSSVTVPQLSSSKFIPFASSCLGIAISLLDKKTNRQIKVGLSGSIDTAYADPTKSLIVISNKFMRGDFSKIGAANKLSAARTVGTVLGVIVHEIGHFAYSPTDLNGYVSFVESRTTKQFSFQLARTLANVLEDIFIEYQIARLAPTLAWALDEINRIMLTDQLWRESVATMKSSPTDPNQIINFLLFAKVVPSVGRVSPVAKNLFSLARTVTKKESLFERFELCLKLYELIAANKPVAPVGKPQPNKPTGDNEPEPEPEPEPTESFDNEPEPEDEPEDDLSLNSGDSSDDPEDNEPEDESNDSDGSMGDSGEPESEDESEDESDSGSTGELEPEDNDPEPTESNDPQVGHSDSSGSPEFDPESVIPQIDTFENRENGPLPYYDELSTELGYRPSLDDHIVIEKIVEYGTESLEMDRRYTKLSEIARQRTNANIGYGEQKTRGRNMRQLYRIATDQKVFATRIAQDTVKPFECMLIMDCSGSMTDFGDNGTVKLIDASKAILGAATGLESGKAIVSVYGHTSDPNQTNKQLKLYSFKNSAESLSTLARRLHSFNYEHYKYSYAYNRDGYALYELSKKFVTTNRQKIMIVVSDGAPNGRGWDYDGRTAEAHTKRMVDALRKNGIKVYSISIDTSAFDPNNRIYGTQFNTCATSADSIDTLIRQLYA